MRLKSTGDYRTSLIDCLIQQEQAFRRYAPKGVSRSAALVFFTVSKSPGMSLTALCKALDLKMQSISPLVASLARPPRKGDALLRYSEDVEDRRVRRLELTNRGERLLDELVTIFQDC